MSNSAQRAYVDLHVHTSASDGLHRPATVVEQANEAGLAAIAITDHDTVGGLAEAEARGRELGVEIVPGIELTSYAGGTEVHILGLFVDTSRTEAVAKVERLRSARRDRMAEIVTRLRPQGVNIDLDEVMAEANGGAVGRPHLARVMVRQGYVMNESEAFFCYLRPGHAAYVRKYQMSPEDAIQLAHELGAASVYAHPVISRLDERLGDFKDAGLTGIEVWHPKHTAADVSHYSRLAAKRGLAASGGSDYHGQGRSEAAIGTPRIERSVLDRLREAHLASTGARSA